MKSSNALLVIYLDALIAKAEHNCMLGTNPFLDVSQTLAQIATTL